MSTPSAPLGVSDGLVVRTSRKTSMRQMLAGIPKGFLRECAAKYFAALAAPWSPEAQGSCIPDGNARESHKLSAFGRATLFTSNSTGYGMVAVCPSVAGDLPCVYYTASPTCISQNLSPITVTAGVASVTPGWLPLYLENNPYRTNQLIPSSVASGSSGQTTVAGRIVSSSVRLRYTGTVMDCGGLIYCYNAPDHSNLYGEGVSDLGKYASCAINNVKIDGECEICDYGRTSIETTYTNPSIGVVNNQGSSLEYFTQQLFPFSNNAPAIIANSGPPYVASVAGGNGAGWGAITSAIIVVAPSTTPISFHLEMCQHMEFVGSAAQHSVTPTHRDIEGFNHVQEAVARAPQVQQSRGSSWMEALGQGLKDVAIEYGPSMIAGGAKVLAGLFL